VDGFPLRLLIVMAAFAPALPIGTLLAAISARRGRPPCFSIALVAGALSVFCAFLVFLLKPVADLIVAPWASGLFHAFVLAAVPEESIKLCLFLGIVLRHEDVDPDHDAIISGGWLGLGFALLENFFYVSQHHAWWALAGIRMATAVPDHVILGLVMGALVARARGGGGGWLLALGIPVLLHGLYDWPPLAARGYAPGSTAMLMWLSFAIPVLLVMAAIAAFWIGPELAANGGTTLGLAMDPVTSRRWQRRGTWAAVLLIVIAAACIALACSLAIARPSSFWLLAGAGILPLGLAGLWRQSRPVSTAALPSFAGTSQRDDESRMEARIRRIVDQPTVPRAAP
jgi:RsiW-degrading membrane proteinase PrsW (M82 family)